MCRPLAQEQGGPGKPRRKKSVRTMCRASSASVRAEQERVEPDLADARKTDAELDVLDRCRSVPLGIEAPTPETRRGGRRRDPPRTSSRAPRPAGGRDGAGGCESSKRCPSPRRVVVRAEHRDQLRRASNATRTRSNASACAARRRRRRRGCRRLRGAPRRCGRRPVPGARTRRRRRLSPCGRSLRGLLAVHRASDSGRSVAGTTADSDGWFSVVASRRMTVIVRRRAEPADRLARLWARSDVPD